MTSISVLPAKECSGEVRWRPGSPRSQLSPAFLLPFPPPRPEAKEKLLRITSAHLLGSSARRNPQPQAQVLNRKWKAEGLQARQRAGSQGDQPTPSTHPHTAVPSSHLEAVSPPPQHVRAEPWAPLK